MWSEGSKRWHLYPGRNLGQGAEERFEVSRRLRLLQTSVTRAGELVFSPVEDRSRPFLQWTNAVRVDVSREKGEAEKGSGEERNEVSRGIPTREVIMKEESGEILKPNSAAGTARYRREVVWAGVASHINGLD